jgi:hypothetical protein
MPLVLGIPLWLLIVAIIVISVVLASVRNDFVEGVGEVINVPGSALDQAADWLLALQRSPAPVAGFERAVLFAAMFILVGPGDTFLMAARVAVMLGMEETAIPGWIGITVGLAVILSEVVYVLAWLDLSSKVPPPPWDELPEAVIDFLKRHVFQLAVVTALTAGASWFYGAMAVTGLYFDGLAWLLTLLLGLELAGAAALAFAVGRRAFKALLLGFVALLGGSLKLLVVLLDGLAAALTKVIDIAEITGRRSWDWFSGTGVGRWLNFRPMPPRQARPRIGRRPKQDVSYALDEREETMKTKARYSLLAVGKVGADIALDVGTADVGWGVFDKDRPSLGLTAPAAVVNGSTNVSPGSPAVARGRTSAIETMFTRAGEVHVEKEVVSGVTTVVLDGSDDVMPLVARLAKRFPDERLVLVSDVTEHGRCQNGEPACIGMHFDLSAPLVSKMSYERFVSVPASLMNALHVASEQYPQNLTLGQLAERLLERGRCYGFRSHSELCAPGRMVPVFGPVVKRLGGFTPSYGDPLDVLNRARTACDLALMERTDSAVNEPIDLTAPFAAVFRLPLPPRHPGFAPTVRELDSWLRQTYPQAQAVYGSGNGVAPVAAMGKERWAQCIVLFPLRSDADGNGEVRRGRGRRPTAS